MNIFRKMSSITKDMEAVNAAFQSALTEKAEAKAVLEKEQNTLSAIKAEEAAAIKAFAAKANAIIAEGYRAGREKPGTQEEKSIEFNKLNDARLSAEKEFRKLRGEAALKVEAAEDEVNRLEKKAARLLHEREAVLCELEDAQDVAYQRHLRAEQAEEDYLRIEAERWEARDEYYRRRVEQADQRVEEKRWKMAHDAKQKELNDVFGTDFANVEIPDAIAQAISQYPTRWQKKKLTEYSREIFTGSASEERLEHIDRKVKRILRDQEKAKADISHVWDDDHAKNAFYKRMLAINMIAGVEQGANSLSEHSSYAEEKVLVCPWKDLGFKHCPVVLRIDNDIFKLYCESNSGLKHGVAMFLREDFYDELGLNEDDYVVFEDEASKDLAKKIYEMKKEASLLEQEVIEANAPKTTEEQNARYAKNKKILDIWTDIVEKSKNVKKHLANSKRPVAKVNQERALVTTPANPIGRVPFENDIAIVKDIERENDLPGKEWIDPKTYEKFVKEKIVLKVTDGSALCPLARAKALGISDRCCAFQVRDDAGSLKGLLIVVPDEMFDGISEIVSEQTYSDSKKEFARRMIVFESVAKNFKRYKSFADYMKVSHKLRKLDTYMKVDGEVHMSRQTFQALMWAATCSEIAEAAKKTIDKFDIYKSAEGYRELENRIIKQLRTKQFEGLHGSPVTKNSIAKQAWNEIVRSAAGKLVVNGAELFASFDIQHIIDIVGGREGAHVYLKKGECLVDRRTGLKIGDEVVVCRYPYINPMPTILKVVGYTNVPGLIELSIDDTVMLNLDSDFDGDHLMVLWEPAILCAAKRAIEICKRAKAYTLGFEDVPASEEAKCATLDEYYTASSKMGDVGVATSPIFILYAMIPLESDENTTVRLGEYELTVGQILRILQMVKVSITIEADAGKRMAKGEFGKTSIAKMIRELRADWCPISEYFAHPYEVELKTYKVEEEDGSESEKLIFHKNAWESADNDGERMIIGRSKIRSAMTEIHDIMYEGVIGDMDTWLMSYTDVLVPDEGFVIAPEKQEGVPIENWFVETGIESYDKRPKAPFMIPKDMIDENEEALLCGQRRLNASVPESERRFYVSLSPNAYLLGLSIGLLHHRVMRCVMANNAAISDPRNRVELSLARKTVDEKMIDVVVSVFAWRGEMITADQARLVLYDELGKYLLGEHANESSAADIQHFFAAYKDIYEDVWRKKTGTVENIEDADDDDLFKADLDDAEEGDE